VLEVGPRGSASQQNVDGGGTNGGVGNDALEGQISRLTCEPIRRPST
jgi:hypothetical protein